MSQDNIPVIIGVGQVNDRTADLAQALDAMSLMERAVRAAESDSGTKLLHEIDWLSVIDEISFPDPELEHHFAKALGVSPRHVLRTPDGSGDGPVRLINDAANIIASGEARLAVAVGGEAVRTANKRMQLVRPESSVEQKFDLMTDASEGFQTPFACSYGFVTPTDIYPLYENATRAAWGQSLAEAQQETATIWACNSEVAAANPGAWLPRAASQAEILEVTPDNRRISFPYTKFMVANNAVNQGAAVILASWGKARELGIPEERLIFVGRGAAAHEPDDYFRRDGFTRSVSMTATLEKTLAFNEISAGDLDYVEFYSCFPCIPKMARRVVDWPLERPHSIYGGLTFGGAPVGNCMMHAAVALVRKLRADTGDEKGLIFGNGGFATHNHAIVLGRRLGRDAAAPHAYDVQTVAEASRGPAPELLESYSGPGVIETYVMPYGRDGEPRFASIVARTPTGGRFLAHVPPNDRATLRFLAWAEGEPVGTPGNAIPLSGGRARWTR